MEMDMLPASRLPQPHAGFCGGAGNGRSISGQALIQSDISDDGHVTHEPDMRRTHGGLAAAFRWPQVEIKLVKFQTFDERALGFGFEGSQGWIAQLLVGSPIRLCNTVEQPLIELQQLLNVRIVHAITSITRVVDDDSPR